MVEIRFADIQADGAQRQNLLELRCRYGDGLPFIQADVVFTKSQLIALPALNASERVPPLE